MKKFPLQFHVGIIKAKTPFPEIFFFNFVGFQDNEKSVAAKRYKLKRFGVGMRIQFNPQRFFIGLSLYALNHDKQAKYEQLQWFGKPVEMFVFRKIKPTVQITPYYKFHIHGGQVSERCRQQ